MADLAGMIWILELALAGIPGEQPAAHQVPTATVGMPIRIRDLVLPGPELEVRPIDPDDPIVLRIAAVYPHGTAWRYDLECHGLEPGDYDLGDWLQPKDGSSAANLPPIPVTIRSILPPGTVRPHRQAPRSVRGLGGYQTRLLLGGALWLIGMGFIIFYRRRRAGDGVGGGAARPMTLAERLRPMVEKAIDGTLTRQERAALELGLLAYWRRRLGLDEEAPAQALAKLKDHDEAGPLLEALENWLHRPVAREEVDLEALLKPYAQLPADALEAEVVH